MPIRGPTLTRVLRPCGARLDEFLSNLALASAGGLTRLLVCVARLWLLPLLTGLLIAVGRLLLLLLIACLLAGVSRLLILLITGLPAARGRLLILLITVRGILILLRLLRTEHRIGVRLRPRLLADRRRLLTKQNFKKIERTRLGAAHASASRPLRATSRFLLRLGLLGRFQRQRGILRRRYRHFDRRHADRNDVGRRLIDRVALFGICVAALGWKAGQLRFRLFRMRPRVRQVSQSTKLIRTLQRGMDEELTGFGLSIAIRQHAARGHAWGRQRPT